MMVLGPKPEWSEIPEAEQNIITVQTLLDLLPIVEAQGWIVGWQHTETTKGKKGHGWLESHPSDRDPLSMLLLILLHDVDPKLVPSSSSLRVGAHGSYTLAEALLGRELTRTEGEAVRIVDAALMAGSKDDPRMWDGWLMDTAARHGWRNPQDLRHRLLDIFKLEEVW